MPQCLCFTKTTGLRCKKFTIKYSFYCSEHQKCQKSIDDWPLKKQMIVTFIKAKLAEMPLTKGKANKIALSESIFKILDTPEGHQFINEHPVFKLTIKNKLIEFIEIEKLLEFIPYYDSLMGEKYIPVPPRIPHIVVASRTHEISLRELEEALNNIKI